MNIESRKITAWAAGFVVLCSGFAFAAPGDSASRQAASILWNLRMDARQVRDHAWQWDILAKTRGVTWYKYDLQWTRIQPAVADLAAKWIRLDQLRASLPAQQQAEVDRCGPLIASIRNDTRNLRSAMNKSYSHVSDLSQLAFPGYAKILARDASRLVRATGAGRTE
jgi:hypothetical protein